MTLTEQYKKNEKYIKYWGLENVINWGYRGERFNPVSNDLILLHQAIVQNGVWKILEFGVGFSTIIMAHAISQIAKIFNKKDCELYSIETNKKYADIVKSEIPQELEKYIHIELSDAKICDYNGQMVHCYNHLPDIIPNFIYIDGPDPKDVEGNYHGLTFNDRPPIAVDPLFYEHSMSLNSIIAVDGRINNVNFLITNLKRKWVIQKKRVELDYAERMTIFKLQPEEFYIING